MTHTVPIWDDLFEDYFEIPAHGALNQQAARQHQFGNLTFEQALEYEPPANDS